MILTWAERCEKFADEIVTNRKIQEVMQEEIDELREEIAMLKQIIDANNLQSDIGQLKKVSEK